MAFSSQVLMEEASGLVGEPVQGILLLEVGLEA